MTKPYSRILCIDFETRWASKQCEWSGPDGYTLSKMTTEAYIRDPLFKAFGCCVHEVGSSDPTIWLAHDKLSAYFASVDWTTTAVLAHNAQFDVGILSFVYGVRPCFIFDTLSMGRALRGVEVGNSLAKLAEDYGLPPKGRAVHSTDGLSELEPHVEQELAAYCKHDVTLCEQIFGAFMLRVDPVTRLSQGPYPTKELRLIDMTVRMYTDPALMLDSAMLQDALTEETAKLEGALARAGVEESTLASNAHFADVLRSLGCEPPTKVSKTTNKEGYAFAKNDALFQALLNGDDEDVALLCEARLRVKSTAVRTRAQRFIDIASRGALPVPLSYYGAATGRWTASKGSSINMQNLKRGSVLRKAITAPDGYLLCVGDLSQIEPRVLAWLADYYAMLAVFKAGGDPYATFGTQMFNVPGMTKESHPLLRQSAKSAMLGCFGSKTPVLTKRGWVTILDVTKEDLLWDGQEWVQHQGVLAQGEKEVFTAKGVSATSDHEILTEAGWQEWRVVLQKSSLFQSALSLASLPASVGNATERCSTHACAAPAVGKASFIGPTSSTAAAHAAVTVPTRKPSTPGTKRWGILRFAPTAKADNAYLTASAQSLFAALTRRVTSTLTTVGAALKSTLLGLQTVSSSCAILSPSMVGTNRSSSLTGETMSGGTNPATYASSHAQSTCPTSARSQPEKSLSCDGASKPLKQRMQTYDIALAGPRNRYTILTDDGPIIVHNCGYQLGWSAFAGQLLTGFLGAPPVRYTKADAKQLGVTAQDIVEFLGQRHNVDRMKLIAHTCSEEELVVHCMAAKAIIDKYRAAASPVVEFWELLGHMLTECLYGGKEYTHKGVLHFRKGAIEMVNGMEIRYPDLKIERDDSGRAQYTYSDGNKRIKLYPGKICNNVTQGTARIIMSDGLLRVQKRYRVLGTVHDEGINLVPENDREVAPPWVHSCMVQVPKWMPGIPLNADVGIDKRYGNIK